MHIRSYHIHVVVGEHPHEKIDQKSNNFDIMYDPQYYLHFFIILRSYNSQFYLRYISSIYKPPFRNNILSLHVYPYEHPQVTLHAAESQSALHAHVHAGREGQTRCILSVGRKTVVDQLLVGGVVLAVTK